jgi:hypothetical protein
MHRVHEVAFRLGETRYRLADALLRAAVVGEWSAVETVIREGAACAARARAEGTPLAENDVKEALREFRYARDLISAEEAEEWLDVWSLSAEEWRAAIVRERLRRRWADERERTLRDFPPADDALAEAAWPDLVCSGILERLVRELAERAAVAGGAAGEEPSPAVAGPRLPPWMGVAADDDAVRRLQQLEHRYAEERRRTVTPEKVKGAVAAHALEWTHVDAVRVAFPQESMAAEAALRVRVDGERLADVAADVGHRAEAWSGFLESADPTLRARLVGASEGDLLGPLADEDGHALLHLGRRMAPRLEDPRVQEHAARHVWRATAARALEAIEWELPEPRGVHG